MRILEKGLGDIKKEYSEGRKAKTLKKMPDGNPYPYEREYIADHGVQDDEVFDNDRGLDPEDYSPKVLKNIGDDGQG